MKTCSWIKTHSYLSVALTAFFFLASFTFQSESGINILLHSDSDPHISVAQKELVATEKAEEEARHELREAEDQVII
jgi:hypothetical protein